MQFTFEITNPLSLWLLSSAAHACRMAWGYLALIGLEKGGNALTVNSVSLLLLQDGLWKAWLCTVGWCRWAGTGSLFCHFCEENGSLFKILTQGWRLQSPRLRPFFCSYLSPTHQVDVVKTWKCKDGFLFWHIHDLVTWFWKLCKCSFPLMIQGIYLACF